jgi:hypothetical protein
MSVDPAEWKIQTLRGQRLERGLAIRQLNQSGLDRAFSSEVETGSRKENASNQESRAPLRFHRRGALVRQRDSCFLASGRRWMT